MNTPPRPPRPLLFEQKAEQTPVPTKTPVETPEAPSDLTEGQRAISSMPGVTQSKMFFEMFIFQPDPSISKADLIEVFRAAKFLFPPDVFEKLPETAKAHFLRLDRTGAVHPYRGNRRGQG
jgi:hypothetical protein